MQSAESTRVGQEMEKETFCLLSAVAVIAEGWPCQSQECRTDHPCEENWSKYVGHLVLFPRHISGSWIENRALGTPTGRYWVGNIWTCYTTMLTPKFDSISRPEPTVIMYNKYLCKWVEPYFVSSKLWGCVGLSTELL